jgi:hypothetical protein
MICDIWRCVQLLVLHATDRCSVRSYSPCFNASVWSVTCRYEILMLLPGSTQSSSSSQPVTCSHVLHSAPPQSPSHLISTHSPSVPVESCASWHSQLDYKFTSNPSFLPRFFLHTYRTFSYPPLHFNTIANFLHSSCELHAHDCACSDDTSCIAQRGEASPWAGFGHPSGGIFDGLLTALRYFSFIMCCFASARRAWRRIRNQYRW